MIDHPLIPADIEFPDGGDWREQMADEPDPDDRRIKTPPDVIAVLGFDPAQED